MPLKGNIYNFGTKIISAVRNKFLTLLKILATTQRKFDSPDRYSKTFRSYNRKDF